VTSKSGETVTHLARKQGSYIVLRGDYDDSGTFVTSPNGSVCMIVDSGAMVNLLGTSHSLRLANRREPSTGQQLFGAGNAALAHVGQGDMRVRFTHTVYQGDRLPLTPSAVLAVCTNLGLRQTVPKPKQSTRRLEQKLSILCLNDLQTCCFPEFN
jgi:hypothetical protein